MDGGEFVTSGARPARRARAERHAGPGARAGVRLRVVLPLSRGRVLKYAGVYARDNIQKHETSTFTFIIKVYYHKYLFLHLKLKPRQVKQGAHPRRMFAA